VGRFGKDLDVFLFFLGFFFGGIYLGFIYLLFFLYFEKL